MKYWRSLDELAGSDAFKEFLHKEFQEVATQEPSQPERRRFIQLMGASFALASGGCLWEKEHILPFRRRPEGTVPGTRKRYASMVESQGHAVGLHVTTYDGRPIKVDGNPGHPASLGATGAREQASILGLYDPDRSRHYLKREGNQWTGMRRRQAIDFVQDKAKAWAATEGEGVAVVTGISNAPTYRRLVERFRAQYPKAKWVEFESIHRDAESAGARLAFGGETVRTHLHLKKTKVLLSLDGDMFTDHPNRLALAREWVGGRRPEDKIMNRLYAVESRHSTVGASADHRLALRWEQIYPFAIALAEQLSASEGNRIPVPETSFLNEPEIRRWLDAVVDDLKKNKGKALVVAGPSQPSAVHALVHSINQALGAPGATLTYSQDITRRSVESGMTELVKDIEEGRIRELWSLDTNPVYSAPGDWSLAKAFAKVQERVHIGLYVDESAEGCAYHFPLAHPFESWGDGLSYDGTYTLRQPLLDPLYDGLSSIEWLALLSGESSGKGQALVQETFAAGAHFAGKNWRRAVHDGTVAGTMLSPVAFPEMKFSDLPVPAASAWAAKGTGLEMTFFDDGKAGDGRFANNAWLQELPEFMTKLTWDNAALISPQTAKDFEVTDRDLCRFEVAGRAVDLPVYILPGQPYGSVAVALGYGRWRAGVVGGHDEEGIRSAGFDVGPLRNGASPFQIAGVGLKKLGKTFALATTQDHHAIDSSGAHEQEQRAHVLIREGGLADYLKNPDFVQNMDHHPPLLSLFDEHRYDGHKWGMAIDLSSCVGCNGCTVACQSENNVPVVGKEQVLKGREMHWLRIDRYFKGEDPEQATAATQPVMCVQCENAPCEQVCPVAATTHSDEGLNDMAYNRCIGTRYCANNCPYKVRRFNFHNYHEDLKKPRYKVQTMIYNPDVTVRFRGVMEKCTYCVQRISEAKHDARIEGRTLKDGDITPACAQACPTEAITFGDLNDSRSRVAQLQGLKRSYAMLAELNIKPRTQYLARITNPNPVLVPEKKREAH